MKIQIITKAKSRLNKVVKLTEFVYEVSVTAPPVDGRANLAVVDVLANHFNVHKNQIEIISGFTSINKTISIDM